jgi:ABC-type Fe3+-hydroxamate transport system substrate-binding protein
MAAGGDTFIHEMMKQMGLENVLADQLRYPQLSTADIQAKAPDLILLSSEPYPFKNKHMEALQPLVPQAKIRLVDGSMFSWYGSRIEKAVDYLQALSMELKGKQRGASLPS